MSRYLSSLYSLFAVDNSEYHTFIMFAVSPFLDPTKMSRFVFVFAVRFYKQTPPLISDHKIQIPIPINCDVINGKNYMSLVRY